MNEQYATKDYIESAQLIGSIISENSRPAHVWVIRSERRFILAGESFIPTVRHKLVGIYNREVTIDMLIEDFEYMLEEPT